MISDWSSCASPRSYDISAESDGDFTFRVRATDTAGNTGVEATHDYTLDRARLDLQHRRQPGDALDQPHAAVVVLR